MEPKPWEPQANEDRASYAWFNQYLLLEPPRVLAKMARRPGCPWTWAQLEDFAYHWRWKERADAWDQHQERQRIAIVERHNEESAEEIGRHHAKVWRRTMRGAERELDKILAHAANSETPTMPLKDVVRVIELGTRTERLIMGQTASNEGRLDLTKLSDQELEYWHHLTQKATMAGEDGG